MHLKKRIFPLFCGHPDPGGPLGSVVLPGDVRYYYVANATRYNMDRVGFDVSSWDDDASGIGFGDDDDAILIVLERAQSTRPRNIF